MVAGTIPVDSLPPLGMALVAAVLKQAGHNVSAIDAISLNPSQINEHEVIPVFSSKIPREHKLVTMGLTFKQVGDLVPPDVDVIGISSMFSINWPADRALLNYLAERFPKALLIGGGESITGMAETCLKQVDALKVCVAGEGESTILDLVDALKEGKPISDLPGIIYKDKDNKIHHNPSRTRIRDVDDMPIPAWELFPVENYQRHEVRKGETARKTLPILATRGCPYRCTFCTSPDMWGTRYYMRTPAKVVEEIEYVKNTYGVTNFEFYDLTAIIQKRWIIEFAGILIARGLDITWKIPAGTRSEAIDSEVARYLYQSGCYFITYAPESGSPPLLEKIKKKVSLPSILQSMKYSKDEGMIVFINMIFGLPDETHKDIWRTLWFLVKCSRIGIDELALAIFRPYPGSTLFNRLLQEKKIQIDNDDYIIESIFIIDTLMENTFYNEGVHKYWYRVYHILAYVVFYGSGYVFRPYRFFQGLVNVFFSRYNNRFERSISIAIDQVKNQVRTALNYEV